jgi:hypothetical protein
MKKIANLSLCVILSLFLTACFDSSEVKKVKGGVLQLCPNHTVDQMVKGFMGSPTWESGKSADGDSFVNVEGDITFQDKPVRATVQFIVKGDNFSFNAFEMNGVPSANMIGIGMLNKMCLSAEGTVEEKLAEKTPEVPTQEAQTDQAPAVKTTLVECQIDSNNTPVYKGKCLFSSEQGGSFSLSNPLNDKPLYDTINFVNVNVVEAGVADVRALTSDGMNSRWGEAGRSSQDRACWVGADFKVCAW